MSKIFKVEGFLTFIVMIIACYLTIIFICLVTDHYEGLRLFSVKNTPVCVSRVCNSIAESLPIITDSLGSISTLPKFTGMKKIIIFIYLYCNSFFLLLCDLFVCLYRHESIKENSLEVCFLSLGVEDGDLKNLFWLWNFMSHLIRIHKELFLLSFELVNKERCSGDFPNGVERTARQWNSWALSKGNNEFVLSYTKCTHPHHRQPLYTLCPRPWNLC